MSFNNFLFACLPYTSTGKMTFCAYQNTLDLIAGISWTWVWMLQTEKSNKDVNIVKCHEWETMKLERFNMQILLFKKTIKSFAVWKWQSWICRKAFSWAISLLRTVMYILPVFCSQCKACDYEIGETVILRSKQRIALKPRFFGNTDNYYFLCFISRSSLFF